MNEWIDHCGVGEEKKQRHNGNVEQIIRSSPYSIFLFVSLYLWLAVSSRLFVYYKQQTQTHSYIWLFSYCVHVYMYADWIAAVDATALKQSRTEAILLRSGLTAGKEKEKRQGRIIITPSHFHSSPKNL